MGVQLSYDSEGMYHDDDIRIESYAEVADIKPEIEPAFVNKVVQSIQMEIGSEILMNPKMSVQQIKLAAMNRFVDLIDRELLSSREAEKCYQRFAYMVDYYYGTA